MRNSNTFVGLDVHKEKINIAVADCESREVRSFGSVNGSHEAIHKVLRRLISQGKQPAVVYEAGPTGYALQRYLTEKGIPATMLRRKFIASNKPSEPKTTMSCSPWAYATAGAKNIAAIAMQV